MMKGLDYTMFMNKNSLNVRKRITAIVLMFVSVIGFSCLSGCSQATEKISNAFQNTELGKQVTSSHTTTDDDRKLYYHVQDVNGNEYTTVVKFTRKGSNEFDVQEVKDALARGSVNWYQMITGDSRGTGKLETGYIYLPESATYSDLESVLSAMSDYDCEIMTQSSYDEYLAQDHDNNIYYVESTTYGPAHDTEESAQSSSDSE